MTRPVALRILILAAAIGLVAQALLLDSLLGVNAPILSGLLLGAAYLLRPAGRSIDPLDLWLPPSAMAISLALALRADQTLLLLDVMAACLLLGASVAAIGGEAVTRRSAAAVVELGLMVLGWAGVGILRVAATLSRHDPRPAGDDPEVARRRLPPWVAPIGRGLLIAIPVLVVFASLFSAADVAFGRIVERLFAWNIDPGEVPFRLAVAFFIAWGVAGLLGVASGALDVDHPGRVGPTALGRATPVAQSLGAAAARDLPDRSSPFPRLGSIEAATILTAVDALFGVFVLVQFAYLFGGQDTLAATGLPYAQYARSGFFELVWVAVLAGGLLMTVHAIAARRTSALVGAGIVLAALTGVVLVSALLRMRIYQDAYGWTELRFFVLAIIAWLAIGVGITIVLLSRDRMRWLLHGLAFAALVVLGGVNVLGPSRVIADQNVARVLDPTLVPPDGRSGLDVRYAVRLGDDAIPALVAVLPSLSRADRSALQLQLELRRAALSEPDARAWPSFNLGREAARSALATLTP